MLFNSAHFAIFFPIVAAAFFLLGHRYRWVLLLAAIYYFYMAWEPTYAILIAASTIVDYIVARKIHKSPSLASKRGWLILSLVTNLGLLFTFKYYNFFAESLQYLVGAFDLSLELKESNLLLPVGISFYTFQTLSYTIECYKGKFNPEKHPGIFGLYVAFFPQLVAGPIERPQNLLKQLRSKVTYDYDRITLGLKRIAWGLFKKVVIADRLALLVNVVYMDPDHHQGPAFVLATIFFAFQIYCDFSGYSDIAIGAAKVLGIDLMENFKSPYFSTSIAEFWRRWHISLSTWFRDYVYYPLGGLSSSFSRRIMALVLVFTLSGLWHGANWTFVIWGALHGFYLLTALLLSKSLKKFRKLAGFNRRPILAAVVKIAITFILVNFAWIFFRSSNLDEAIYIVSHLHQGWDTVSWYWLMTGTGFEDSYMKISLWLIVILIVYDTIDVRYSMWTVLSKRPWWIRWFVYYAIVCGIYFYGVFGESEFLYFQF